MSDRHAVVDGLSQAEGPLSAELAGLADSILQRCAARGARQAEVSLSSDLGLSVTVRLGEVETIERRQDRGVGITVYFGQQRGTASTADLADASIQATIDQACAIARHTEPDPWAGLADPERLARDWPALDLWHPWQAEADDVVDLALRCETAGRELDRRIDNSDGANVSLGHSLEVYGNSHGFLGTERRSMHSISCSLVARAADGGLQRDYWYDAARAGPDLMAPEAIGRRAAERALARLGARSLSTRQCPVLFVPETARGLIGHFLGAVSGPAQYRKASFLLGQAGNQVLPAFLGLIEQPHLPRGHGSRGFDDEGVATRDSVLVENGVLVRYLLDSYSARRLGLASTANAGGVHNLALQTASPGEDFPALLARMDRGLVVTELMGQGVNPVTGDYSRGASGFWVESGQIAHPVTEVTIAGNLRQMLTGIVAVGADVDRRSHLLTGSLLIDRMTVAGS